MVRGEIKPRLARTVAYMFQTLMQSTRLAQHEYINAFGTDGWRDAVCTSVTSNHDYLFPPHPNAPGTEDESEDSPETDAADDVHPAPSRTRGSSMPRQRPYGPGLFTLLALRIEGSLEEPGPIAPPRPTGQYNRHPHHPLLRRRHHPSRRRQLRRPPVPRPPKPKPP